MKIVLLALALVCPALAQDTPSVSLSEGVANSAYQKVYAYTGANLIYACTARSVNDARTTKIAISAVTNASPAAITSTAHGFPLAGARPSITISGGTGAWIPANGTWIATITGANTFTIPLDTTAFGAVAGTLVFTTTAPRLTVAEWSVKLYSYDGSNNLIWSGWLNGSNVASKCSDGPSLILAAQ